MRWNLTALREAEAIGPLDEHLARTLGRLGRETRDDVLLAIAVLSQKVGAGHVCIDLQALTGQPLLGGTPTALPDFRWPDPTEWSEALRTSGVVGKPSGDEPLVLHGQRLYLRRYWEHELQLAAAISARANDVVLDVDRTVLGAGLDAHFGSALHDAQRRAAETAVRRRLCIITGGPGTGKTSTVVRVLALLIEQALACGARTPRVLLLAPTGKAAARMLAAIEKAKVALPPRVRDAIPQGASTIHRALRPIRGRLTSFRHHREHPLLADVVVVDEASMVDLALMARLVDAVPAQARLLLLGDKDQLASVEAGAVLGDLCDAGVHTPGARSRPSRPPRRRAPAGQLALFEDEASRAATVEAPIARCIVELTTSYRYGDDSGIGALARAINRGDAEAALSVLASAKDVSLVEPADGFRLSRELRDEVLESYAPYLQADDPGPALAAFDRYKILCAHRRGPGGVVTTNRLVGDALRDAGLLAPSAGLHFHGQPVLVTSNDYRVELFNGDVGLLWNVAVGLGAESVRAFFVSSDGRRRAFSPSRLPPHETVWAMSVHKSQGSEFDAVSVLLPSEASPIVSRELLYTAVTRARRRVAIHADADIVRHAIGTRIERASGLRDALWS